MTTVTCPNCGFQTDDRARFCEKCGTALPAAAQPVAQRGYAAAPAYGIPEAFPGVRYGGFWLRFVAIILDYIVLGLLFTPVALLFAFAGMTAGGWDRPEMIGGMMGAQIVPLWFLLWLAYFTALESSTHQATLGKLVAGLKVTDMNGQRLSFLHAGARNLCKIISQLTLGIGYIMAGFTARKQALHDLIVSALVVRR